VDRSTQWAVVLTAVGIVALALSAATLPSTVSTDSVGIGGTNESGSGFLPESDGINPDRTGIDPPEWLVTGLIALMLLFTGIYVLLEPKKAVMEAVIVGAVVTAVFLALLAAAELLENLQGGGGRGGGLFGGGGSRATGGEVVSATGDASLLAVAAAVGAMVVIAAVARYSATGDATSEEQRTVAAADGGDGDGIEGVAQAAGRAADRIEEETGVDNEVYRAWREMATLLGAERPETSTPGEFADDAVAAGMDPEDVDELTRLFEAVRYGDSPPTEEREQRAVTILRRIEATYAGEEEQRP
jgi:hypothetical protein